MADLYGTIASSSSSSPPPSSSPALAPESDEMSLILHQLLNNSSSSYPSYSSCASHVMKHVTSSSTPPETSSAAGFLRVGDGRSSGVGFSYPGFDCATDESGKVFSSLNGGSCDAIALSVKRRRFSVENDGEDFGCDSEGDDASEVPLDPVPSRTSSKRTRAAEVHNLSEKRRRSKINEKMRELQKLIPNSNKTDKASMLDEAIEYLKQLQLQVQMLSMRNGLTLHPVYLPGVLQPMQVPQTGPCFDDEGSGRLNVNRGTSTFLVNQQETTPQAAFDILEECTLPNQRIVIPTNTSIANSGTPFGLEPSMQAHYGPFNLSTSSKEICREDRKPQLQLEMTHSGKNIMPGVSS